LEKLKICMLGNRRSLTSRIPGLPISFSHKSVLTARLLLALLSIISSLALAFILLENTRSTAHADPALVEASVPVFNSSFPAYSWGLAFDKSGHIWVAEPQCDINGTKAPICSNTIQSGILEYTRQAFRISAILCSLMSHQVTRAHFSWHLIVVEISGLLNR
jgi:hypothetical protein